MNQKVFINRTLNMKKIKYIGFDMDHTIIRYNSEKFESSVYDFVVNYLISSKHYPQSIANLEFKFDNAIRGSVVDTSNGNILKLSRYGAIRQSYHGIWPIHFNEQKQIYRSTYVDLNDPNYIAIDTAFSIAFCVLFGQLVDFKDTNPQSLPSYETMAFDILYSVDKIHADGRLKQHISENLPEYVMHDPDVVSGLLKFKEHGKKIFVLTNSDYHYTKLMLDYAINPFLPSGETWQSLFEFTITLSNKPRFFYDNLKFLNVDPNTGQMTNLNGPVIPGIYQGGNAKQFTNDLSLNGDEILYIGDHIYGDILRLKKDCNWRTALVVEELGAEITGQIKSRPIEDKIVSSMDMKKELEQKLIEIQADTANQEKKQETQKLQDSIQDIDKKVAALIKEQKTYFNPTWGRIFRAGAEESYFAYQVERYACIYMEKLSDLLELSPLTYFRANRRRLAHDPQ
ncbi:MAG: HAD-IG family 5'-nucleotidase [Legionellaceae bacterium]|nr:HAD-IG family 5'-nucleotidase [Legionellaceae bacterium]